uniref:Replicative DNA helicase n=1 Tax=Apophlaea sinclairii TaxID=212746 RepID=A0A1C9CBP5_9FLOR|nr:replication helicase subunit [Apophlaea sinclairii]AOM65818.1 replication helicase subunit [Apophlaea sinclairii]
MMKSFFSIPPHNILAEELFIGVILLNLNKHYILKLNNQVNINALILESHKILYISITNHIQDSHFDLIELIRYLSNYNLLSQVGGLDKILELMTQILVFQRFSCQELILNYYVQIIEDKYVRRQIIQWATHIINLSLSESIELSLILKQASKHLEAFFFEQKKSKTFNLSVILYDLVKTLRLNHKHSLKLNYLGLQCGLTILDKLTQGFQPSDLIILAGRPGMGKTSIALNMTNHIMQNTRKGIIFFSFEMSRQQILYKLLSIQSKINVHRLKNGLINTPELLKVKQNCKVIAQSFLYIDDTINTTIFDLDIKVKEILQYYNIEFIVIDYLQLIQHSGTQFNNRVQELSSITRILKILAKETYIPLMVLSQLNRSVENRSNKKPLLSDLRESGCFHGITYCMYHYKSFFIRKIIIYFIYRAESIENKYLVTRNHIAQTSFSGKQYVYNTCLFTNFSLQITDNHKLLTFMGWKKQKVVINLNQITTIVNNSYFKLLKYNICHFRELLCIIYYKNKLVYDIHINKLFNFDIQHIIVHNSIEQDADLVLLLYRDDYYKTESNPDKLAEIIIAKHRNGPTGNFTIHFDAPYTTFTDY